MSVGTALSRISGLVRLIATVVALGIIETRLADAYNTANTTPNIVYELVLGGVLTSVFVPVFVEWRETRGREEAWDVARRALSLAVTTLGAVTLIGMVAAPWIIRAYTIRVPEEERAAILDLAPFFLLFFIPQILFYGVGAVATGLLNAHRRFAAPMFAPILNNLVVIATMVAFALLPGPEAPGELATTAQRYVLAGGTTLGVIVMTVVLWPPLRGLGFRFHWVWDWRHEAVGRIARLARWVVVYVAANQIAYLLVIVLAYRVRGGPAAYAYAFIVFQLPHAIFAVSIFTALLPALSSRWSAADRAGFLQMLSRGLRMTALVIAPAALGLLALSLPISRLLFGHGPLATAAQGARQVGFVADILWAFALGLLAFSTFQLLTRAFYAMQDSRTPALINVGANFVNVAANCLFVLVFGLGVPGLALGHATAYAVGTLALLIAMRRRLGSLDGRRVASGIARAFLAGGAAALVAWFVARLIEEALGTATLGAQALQVLAAVGAGLLVFASVTLIVRMEEVDTLRMILKTRFGR